MAGGLFVCIALLVLAVFLTRDEDNLQADNLLAERFTLEVGPRRGHSTCAGSRRSSGTACCSSPRARRARRSRAGSAASGPGSTPSTAATCLIFRRGDEVVRFADYRGLGRFEGFERPFDELPPVLHAEDGVITGS